MKDAFIYRLFRGNLSVYQWIYLGLFLLTLLPWPMLAFVSMFIFDSPTQSRYDEISRDGIALTILAYPLLLFILFKLGFKLSRWRNSPVWFYVLPWTPFLLLVAFFLLDSSELAQSKPDNYDPETFERIDVSYSKDKNHAYYLNEVIEGALPESFEVLGEGYSKDALHGFYERELIPGADPASLVLAERQSRNQFFRVLAHDGKDYYDGSTPLHVADHDSFKAVGEGWFIDRKQVYFLGLIPQKRETRRMPIADYDSFRMLNYRYACDNKCVYYNDTIVEGADPATIRVVEDPLVVAQDKHCVYFEGRATDVKDFAKLKGHPLNGSRGMFYTEGVNVYNHDLQKMPEGTDAGSLRKVTDYRDWYADKNRVYYENRVIPNADPSKIEVFPSYYLFKDYSSHNNKNSLYSHDGTHVYYKDSLMHDVDIATFKCGYDFVDSVSFAFDKNKYYKGLPTSRTEQLKAGNL